MERIGGRNLLMGAAIFLIGLLLGWLAIGWWLWPVQYYDTDPQDLRPSHKEVWMAMVADSYSLNGDIELAKERLQGFEEEEIGETLSALVARWEKEGDLPGVQRLKALAQALGVTLPAATPAVTPAATPKATVTPRPTVPTATSLLQRWGRVCGLFLLVVAAVVGIGLALSRWQARRERVAPVVGREELTGWEAPEEPALGQFITTYTLGDDGYDTSFNIETPAGEFYGACGVGFSEVIGQGTPDKITAFEVWLFDKTDPNNVQTVTKVLMSEYAYGDEPLRERMKERGEAVLVERGKRIAIEGVGLKLEAQIVDFAYGMSPALPPNSFFERLTTQLTPMMKTGR